MENKFKKCLFQPSKFSSMLVPDAASSFYCSLTNLMTCFFKDVFINAEEKRKAEKWVFFVVKLLLYNSFQNYLGVYTHV